MDIDYLLALQNFREATTSFFTPIATQASDFMNTFWIFAFLAVFYWLYSTKRGMILWIGFVASRFALNVLKLIACVYRPWIREPRLKPDPDIMKHANGYSFPSGHAVTSGSLFGGLAYWLWRKRKWVAILCIIAMLLVCFSRNYLSVHTPQDVFVGLGLGLLFVFLAPKIFDFMDKLDFKKSTILLVFCLALAIAFLVYINLKTYPIDYIDGKILVEPETMKESGYISAGEFIGFILGWWTNHNFIHYKISRSKLCIIVALIAIIPLFYWDSGIILLFNSFFSKGVAGMITRALKLIYIFALVPLILKRCQNANEISD
ncbi:MAG: phosphatase PAP2 family protein [Coriobacteriia bacterium]|nr:phosphatase PAP2 family protein [Coriobacteriia bacterium]